MLIVILLISRIGFLKDTPLKCIVRFSSFFKALNDVDLKCCLIAFFMFFRDFIWVLVERCLNFLFKFIGSIVKDINLMYCLDNSHDVKNSITYIIVKRSKGINAFWFQVEIIYRLIFLFKKFCSFKGVTFFKEVIRFLPLFETILRIFPLLGFNGKYLMLF
jgi:hypothetical protein